MFLNLIIPKSTSMASENVFEIFKLSILEFEEITLIASSLLELAISEFKISKLDSIIFIPPCKILSSISGLDKSYVLVCMDFKIIFI